MENRENVFTVFAKDINSFANHEINKVELYKRFVGMIEICDEGEKGERKKYENEYIKYSEEASKTPNPNLNVPYSNFNHGIKLLTKK